MKQIKFHIIALSAALLLLSCKDDTDIIPEPTVGKYETEGKALEAVDALYRTGAPTFYGECTDYHVPAAAVGGYIAGFFEPETRSQLYDNCLSGSPEGMCDYANELWNRARSAIEMCDEVIDNAAVTPGISGEQSRRYIAEARFFRAFNNFYLARAFGLDVQIYEQIISDLNAAIADLPDQGFAANGYRVGRPAAQTLLADVYLTISGFPHKQNRYAQAAQTAQRVIDGKNHALIAHGATPATSAYNVLRTQNGNEECIYAFKPHGSRSLSSLCLSNDAADWGVVRMSTANAYRPTQALLDLYEPGEDLRIGEQQLFHSFVKYEKSERTVIQTFHHTPYFWFDRDALFATGVSQKNITIYRYAEVLLIAAEATAMSEGVTAKAVGYLADVRSRAHPNLERETIVNQLMTLSKDEFVQEIWIERLREFPLEMKIWPDIQRTRQYPVAGSGEITFINAGDRTPNYLLQLPIPGK